MIISAATTPTAIGRNRARKPTSRSCEPPGAAKCWRRLRKARASLVSIRVWLETIARLPLCVGEDIGLGPARKVEQGAGGKEIEARLRQGGPALALQPHGKFVTQAVEITHVAGGIVALGIGKHRPAPVAGLLLLRKAFAQQFLDQVLGGPCRSV